MTIQSKNIKFLENLAYHSAHWAGSPWAYLVAIRFTVTWLFAGIFVHFSDNWQLVMKTASGTVTFLMVFLIQRSQHKDSLAMQIKLNEIIAALNGANNRMISIEDLSEG
jgi:low affinity Fe/Cu permease